MIVNFDLMSDNVIEEYISIVAERTGLTTGFLKGSFADKNAHEIHFEQITNVSVEKVVFHDKVIVLEHENYSVSSEAMSIFATSVLIKDNISYIFGSMEVYYSAAVGIIIEFIYNPLD